MRVHETKALDPIDLMVLDGIAVTTPARTLFDLGGVYRKGMVEIALENALRRALVSEAELAATVKRLSRSGRPGGPALRELLEMRDPHRRATESDMETRLLQAVRAHGLPGPVVQYEVWQGAAFIGRVDAAYPDERISDRVRLRRVPLGASRDEAGSKPSA